MRLVCIQEVKIGAAPRGAVGPASAAGLTLAARPPHAGPSEQERMSASAPGDADFANAVANNESGRARTRLELPSRYAGVPQLRGALAGEFGV